MKKEYLDLIVDELEANLSQINEEELNMLADHIWAKKENNIFVYGRGREMMAISAFAMRLSQMGYHSYVVAEPHVPPITKNDLFLVTNGRNMLEAHAEQMRIARDQGAQIIVLTAHPQGGFDTIPVDQIYHFYGQTLDDPIDKTAFYQTMGTGYEHCAFVGLDSVVLKLMAKESLDKNTMEEAYCNFW